MCPFEEISYTPDTSPGNYGYESPWTAQDTTRSTREFEPIWISPAMVFSRPPLGDAVEIIQTACARERDTRVEDMSDDPLRVGLARMAQRETRHVAGEQATYMLFPQDVKAFTRHVWERNPAM